MTKQFWKAALIRALKTFIQTILGVWTAGQVITEIDWKVVFLAAVSAAIYSLLTSVLAGLPEVQLEQTLYSFDNTDGEDPGYWIVEDEDGDE